MIRAVQRKHLRSHRMEHRFNESNVSYSIIDNDFFKDPKTRTGDELHWHYARLGYINASSIGELLEKLSTKLHMTGRQYEWGVDWKEPKLWVHYKDENKEYVWGEIGIYANIPDAEVVDNLVAYGEEHGLYIWDGSWHSL